MSPPRISSETPRFAILGGGISGLTAAFRLSQLVSPATVELYEASDRLGGILFTRRDDHYLIERGADSFITKLPGAVDLCRELGLGNELIPTNLEHRRALVFRQGQLHAVPEGFVVMKAHKVGPILRSPLLSLHGKLRLMLERWAPSPEKLQQADYDESVASFATRRLGREAFERLVQPLLAGIYTADAEQLSLAATMPEFIQAEQEYGSLTRAIRSKSKQPATEREAQDASASGARYGSFVTLRDGLGRLGNELANRLPQACIHLKSTIESLARVENQQWMINLAEGAPQGPFDGVVVALPAPRAATVVHDTDSRLGELLGKIAYASSAVVCLVILRNQVAHPLDGFGFVVPAIEGKSIVAASFSSIKFPGRAPPDQLLVRVFLGGALQPELLDLPDDQLRATALADLREIIGIRGEPLVVDLVRWREKMPQYHVGHVQLVDAIEQQAAQLQGLELAGNAYRGVGIPQCVQSGEMAAHRLAKIVQPETH